MIGTGRVTIIGIRMARNVARGIGAGAALATCRGVGVRRVGGNRSAVVLTRDRPFIGHGGSECALRFTVLRGDSSAPRRD